MPDGRSWPPSPVRPRPRRSTRSRAASSTRSPPRVDVRLLIAALLLASHQSRAHRPELRAGLDTLYGGGFPSAARYFAALAQRDSADPAPLIFEASAYMWWAAALEDDAYEAPRIDSLLERAIGRAATAPPSTARDFWLATALGYRARQRNLRGHAWGAAKDAKAMRDAYARVLAADSACADCWLGLGVYEYGLARDRKSTRLNSSHGSISYAVFCLQKKKPATQAASNGNHIMTRYRPIAKPFCD